MSSANLKSVTNNGGNYASSVLSKATDGDFTTHWETGKPNTSTFTNEVVFQLGEATTLNRIVYAARQDAAKGKGFAQQFDIYSSPTDVGDNYTLVSSGEYTGSTGNIVEIKFAPTSFKRIKFVYKKANQDWASAAEFAFYKEDPVSDAVKSLFTDGTMSSVVPEYNNVAKINALDEAAKVHPLYPLFKDQLNLARQLVNGEVQTEGTMITAEQHGDMKKHAQQNLRMNFGTNNQATGFAAIPGRTINVYVDVESKDKLPSLVFSQQDGGWNSWATSVALHQGKNTITVPAIASNSSYEHEVTKGGTVYIVNPYTAAEQGKAPVLRFEGLDKIPFMTKSTDVAQFKEFLTTYKNKVDQDVAAHPAVKDRQVIDVVELASDRVIFTGTATEAYNQYVTLGKNPVDTLTNYDIWMNRIFDFYGLDGSSDLQDRKLMRENIRLMQPYGFMYAAGDHVGIQLGQVETMLGNFTPGWGISHEIGHRLAIGEREYGEISNNMIAMGMSVAYNDMDNRIPYEDEIYKNVIAENKKAMDQVSLFGRLGAFWQLELAHPGYWAELNRLYRERKVSLSNGDNSKQQYLIDFSSEVLGQDLSSYFARHGFTVNPETKAKTAKYPAPLKLWYLNNSLVGYKGTGIANKNVPIKVTVGVNATAKSNTLNFTMDALNKKDFLGYEIYRNNVLVGFTGTDQFVDTNIDPTVNYTYKIIGYDKKLSALNPVELKAFKPTLSAENQVTLKLNQAFDPMNYVKALDYQGNDITSTVVIKSNTVNLTQKGNYQIVYEIKSGESTETRTTNVAVTSDYAYLSDLNAVSARVGWGDLKKDKAPAGGTITLLRQGAPATYTKGLGAHANSEVVYNVEGKGYDSFESYVGIDQAAKNSVASATFEVYVDGIKVYSSGVFKSGTDHEFVQVPITGAKEIKLVTTDANDNGISSDHTVWADAKFTKGSSAPSLSLPESMTYVKLNTPYDVLQDVQASDIEDGNLTGAIHVEADEFNTKKTGTYPVKYTVTDKDGNTISKTRTFVVYSATAYVSDVNWVSATTDYESVRKDKSISNNPLKVLMDGQVQTFNKGIGTHANSEITYNLTNTRYDYFETLVGIDHNIPNQDNSSVIFKIMADGQEVFNSGVMKYTTEAKRIRISVQGVHELKLIAEDAGNGISSDHADFADAKFLILNNIPTLTIPTPKSTKVGEVVSLDEAYSALDSEDGDLTSKVIVSGADKVDFNQAGEYPITYTVTDSDGNTTTQTRTIAVVDMQNFKYLTDYNWKTTQYSYAAPQKDISISNNKLRLTNAAGSEVSYTRGIGAHSTSTIVYDLSDKNFDYLTSNVGVDRQMFGSIGSVSFEVYVDGVKKFDSGLMNSRDPQKSLEVDINGAKELKLVVTDGGNGNGSDHASWGDTKLYTATGQ
nr:NPCBM/NEW2 domain-containing protein [Paenibacillus shirakamiensis]